MVAVAYFLSFIFNKFFSTSKVVQGVLILKLCIYFILQMVLFFDSIKVEFSRGLEKKDMINIRWKFTKG